ncbi:MAG TPA: hypothetical protein VMV46_13225 [Thermoanaerobaculia bacterium]|nr:hypothetical protein [Thermoanaerobaculia bacterium]
MLFASTDLASRIERAECHLLADAARAIAEREPETRVFLREVAGGVAGYTADGMPFNKLAGLGFGGQPAEDELAEIEEVFASRTGRLQVEVAGGAGAGVVKGLRRSTARSTPSRGT